MAAVVPPLHITIAAAPSSDIALDRELRLVKAALLYADSVSLVSPAVSILGSVAAIGGLSGFDRILLLEDFAGKTLPPAERKKTLESFAIYRRLKSKDKRRRTTLEWQMLGQIEQFMEQLWTQEMLPMIDRLLATSGGDQLIGALEAGVLSIEPLVTEEGMETDQIIDRFVEKIYGMVGDPTVYPLLDDESGTIVRHAVEEGILEPPIIARERGKQIVIAADALGRLPAFPAATVDEVLDIRGDLRDPLVRFRAAMIRLGRLVDGAAYDEHARAEIEELYREHIAPAIQEIEEKVQDTKYLRELLAQVAGSAGPLVTAFVSIGVTRVADLPWILSAAAPAAHVMAGAALARFGPEGKAVSRNEMFFLYRTQQLLDRVR